MFPGALPCLTLLLSLENRVAGSLTVLLSVSMVCCLWTLDQVCRGRQ